MTKMPNGYSSRYSWMVFRWNNADLERLEVREAVDISEDPVFVVGLGHQGFEKKKHS